MENHSTSTALISITDEILRGMDRSEVTLLTLIDLSRCFDTVDHKMLITKLQQLQISTGWIQSYLEGHTQRVRIGQTLSSPKNITIGTFQGSCLGPLLYNIFSNDLSCYIPEHMNGFRVTMVRYADDAQLAITGPRSKLAEMQRSLEAVLDVTGTWFLQHGMMVNAGKTEMILCGDSRQLSRVDPPTIMFKDQVLQCSETVRNLGVIMDPSLSFGSHIDKVVHKCIGILDRHPKCQIRPTTIRTAEDSRRSCIFACEILCPSVWLREPVQYLEIAESFQLRCQSNFGPKKIRSYISCTKTTRLVIRSPICFIF